ncbi:MAG TPA: DUF1801 domain-containing protein [Candidatus Thermoplasmatota archaeon]|nr:DUF1801 domain-containing protein [Candidatus Thermoplasmatota archaeon]
MPEPMGALARAAATKIRAVLPDAQETCEGGDCGFGTAAGYKGLVFTLTPNPTHVTLGFANGATLNDPTGFLEGRGKGHRHVKIESEADLKRGALDRLLQEAVKRRKR